MTPPVGRPSHFTSLSTPGTATRAVFQDFTMADEGNAGPVIASSTTSDIAVRPYHSKRPHAKSRRGCIACKRRKVKCDELRPGCGSCTLRREQCVYATPLTRTASHPVDALPTSPGSSSRKNGHDNAIIPFRDVRAPPSRTSGARVPDFNLVFQPIYTPAQVDGVEMMLLWFYTTKGFETFSIEAGRQQKIDKILRVDIPQHAFGSPFLMNCLLGLSAIHLRRNGRTDISHTRAIAYRARSFEGYRYAIEKADPREFPAILATSMLLCSLASQMFRDPDAKPLHIIDWLMIWRGITLVVELVRPQVLFQSGMAILFMRPPIDVREIVIPLCPVFSIILEVAVGSKSQL